MFIFVDWRFIAFVVLMPLILAAFVVLVMQNAMLYRENQVL
jgi:hypothetical protein